MPLASHLDWSLKLVTRRRATLDEVARWMGAIVRGTKRNALGPASCDSGTVHRMGFAVGDRQVGKWGSGEYIMKFMVHESYVTMIKAIS